MLQVKSTSKRFGGRVVLSSVSFVVNAGEVAGLVGPTGSGKSTLMAIIAGHMAADAGAVELPASSRVAYLPQGRPDLEATAASTFPAVFGAAVLEVDVARLAERLKNERTDELEDAYAAAVDRLATARPSDPEVLFRELRLRPVHPEERLGALSGGELTKLGLVDVALSRPDVLLLDEPTNNLDIEAIEWLEAFVEGFAGPVLAISHDRAFLDDEAMSILELDATTGRVEVFAGNYTAYAAEKGRRNDEAFAAYHRQQERDTRLKAAISGLDAKAQRIENTTINFYVRKRAAKVARRATVMKHRLERELGSGERVERPSRLPYRVHLDLKEAPRSGALLIDAERIGVTVGDRELLRDASFTIRSGARVALLGANGAGKTTLLRAILGEQPIRGGSLRVSQVAKIGYLPQEAGSLLEDAGQDATPLRVIRAAAPQGESDARTFLHRFLFAGDQVSTPIARLSYGELRRLELATIVIRGANVLLLDEPTNHMDIRSREALEAALESYEGAVVMVTHDRYLVQRFAEEALLIEDGRLRLFTPGEAGDLTGGR